MVLPVAAGLGLRGLMSLLGRGAAARSSGQSAIGRALGNKKIMPFATKTPEAMRKAEVDKLIATEQRKALLTALGIGGNVSLIFSTMSS